MKIEDLKVGDEIKLLNNYGWGTLKKGVVFTIKEKGGNDIALDNGTIVNQCYLGDFVLIERGGRVVKESKLELSPSCHLVYAEYCHDAIDVGLEYTEHSQDHWHSDTETYVDLDEEKAKEIIDFLTNAFNL